VNTDIYSRHKKVRVQGVRAHIKKLECKGVRAHIKKLECKGVRAHIKKLECTEVGLKCATKRSYSLSRL